jgi:para-aminobenzoate synthetase
MSSQQPAPATSWAAEIVPVNTDLSTERLFDALYSCAPHAFWLDSARQAYDMGRWSFMGAPTGGALVVWESGSHRWSRCGPDIKELPQSLVAFLSAELDRRPVLEGPIPFLGGFVGYFGYGSPGLNVRASSDPWGPDAYWWEINQFLARDHESGQTFAITAGPQTPLLCDRARTWAQQVSERLKNYHHPPAIARSERRCAATASVNRSQYLRDLSHVRSWLLAGDSYEACYTYQLSLPQTESSWTSYRRLRSANPAPYGGYFVVGKRRILSSSPERFLRVSPSGWAETKPIKGTIARSLDQELDRQLAKKLATDPKSLSENLMIVDLLRNDLARICEPGSVTVPKLMAIESYQTVHQLVTTVRGKIPKPPRPSFYFPSLFPGGSMTGAPKKRTVELLTQIEAVPRSVYSGALGYFSYTGAADLAVVIRTAVIDDHTVRIGTGGAITVKSDHEAEYQETKIKAAPLLGAFQAWHPDNDAD